jgi:hypothetical protein
MSVTVAIPAGRVLDLARGELGVHEEPFGSNKTKYGAWAVAQGHNGMQGVAWCNIFVSWVLAHAGANEIPFYAYTPSSQAWFTKRGAFRDRNYKPKAGDIVWFDFPNDGVNRTSHIGIVEGVLADGRVACIEGNTNGAGGRTGGMVMRHNRARSSIVGFGVIDYQDNELTEAEMEEIMKYLKAIDGHVAATDTNVSDIHGRTDRIEKAIAKIASGGTTPLDLDALAHKVAAQVSADLDLSEDDIKKVASASAKAVVAEIAS